MLRNPIMNPLVRLRIRRSQILPDHEKTDLTAGLSMIGVTGFEPAASCSQSTPRIRRRTQEILISHYLSASVGFRKPSQPIAFRSVLWWYYHIDVVVGLMAGDDGHRGRSRRIARLTT